MWRGCLWLARAGYGCARSKREESSHETPHGCCSSPSRWPGWCSAEEPPRRRRRRTDTSPIELPGGVTIDSMTWPSATDGWVLAGGSDGTRVLLHTSDRRHELGTDRRTRRDERRAGPLRRRQQRMDRRRRRRAVHPRRRGDLDRGEHRRDDHRGGRDGRRRHGARRLPGRRPGRRGGRLVTDRPRRVRRLTGAPAGRRRAAPRRVDERRRRLRRADLQRPHAHRRRRDPRRAMDRLGSHLSRTRTRTRSPDSAPAAPRWRSHAAPRASGTTVRSSGPTSRATPSTGPPSHRRGIRPGASHESISPPPPTTAFESSGSPRPTAPSRSPPRPTREPPGSPAPRSRPAPPPDRSRTFPTAACCWPPLPAAACSAPTDSPGHR